MTHGGSRFAGGKTNGKGGAQRRHLFVALVNIKEEDSGEKSY